MSHTRLEHFNQAVKMRKESTHLMVKDWVDYSLFTSMEFWFLVVLFITPLLFLLWKIDKSKIFLVCFFGFSVHIGTFYISLVNVNIGLWNYPLQIIPVLPSVNLDSSLVPIAYMFLYQWSLNNAKKFYLMMILLSAFFAFVFDFILVEMQILIFYGKMNYFYDFLLYLVVAIFAKLLTNLFLFLQNQKT